MVKADAVSVTKCAFAPASSIVSVRDDAGAVAEMVTVLVVPKRSWLVVALRVSDAKVGVAPMSMFCGVDKVNVPSDCATLT